VWITASAERAFAFIDDPARFAAHMTSSSWMMGGGRMTVDVDAGEGRTVGSHITMSGTVWGLSLSLDEVITSRNPPRYKAWSTIGEPRLVVIGPYSMGVQITSDDRRCHVRVFIDYELPEGWMFKVLGLLLGRLYARWCVRQMLEGVVHTFAPGRQELQVFQT
jgi:hypothetical protein